MKYNIAGIIIQPFLGNRIFTGNLIHEEKNNKLEGKLSDVYGKSIIKGILNLPEGKMEFVKKYKIREDIINYYFKKEGNLWMGEYAGEIASIGEAMCEIYELGKKPIQDWGEIAKNSRLSIGAVEKFSKSVIEGMKQKGYIKSEINHQTGEEFIKLTKKGVRGLTAESEDNLPF